MKKGLLYVLAATAMFTACKNYKKGPGDLYYKVLKEGSGPQIAEGDFVKLNVVEKTEGDSVKMSSYEMDRPFYLPVGKPQFAGDIMDGLKLLKEGDSAMFKISLDSVAKHGGPAREPNSKDKYSIFTFKVEKVLKKGAKDDEKALDEKRREFYMSEMTAYTNKKKAEEPGTIASYIKDNNLKPQSTANGLQYIINKKGTGANAQKGDTVLVNYTGSLMRKNAKNNYIIFDTSVAEKAKEAGHFNPNARYEARPFVVGSTVPGFDEGLQLMNKGSKATLIMPSKLAYGEQGMQLINPYTPLVFDVEVVDIRKPDPNAPKPAAPAQPTAAQIQEMQRQMQQQQQGAQAPAAR